jgi:hypothetical protein
MENANTVPTVDFFIQKSAPNSGNMEIAKPRDAKADVSSSILTFVALR